ncbi:MAG TPA: ATP-binding protein, partial [Citricoccus sp.]
MIPSPSPTDSLLHPSSHAARFPGREAELAQLGAAIDRARSGTPQWVAIEGPPGMGKTPLVDAVLPSLADWRRVVIELDPADSPTPGTLVRHLLTGLTGQRSVTVPDSVPECVRSMLEIIDASEGCTVLVVENL